MKEEFASQLELGEPDSKTIHLEHKTSLAGHFWIASKPFCQSWTFTQLLFVPFSYWWQLEFFWKPFER